MADWYFKLDADAWIAGTLNLAPAEEGVYIRVIVHLRMGRRLPSDPSALARVCGWRSRRVIERPLASLLALGKLIDHNGWLVNPRVEADMVERAAQRGTADGPPATDQNVIRFPPHPVNKS